MSIKNMANSLLSTKDVSSLRLCHIADVWDELKAVNDFRYGLRLDEVNMQLRWYEPRSGRAN